MASSESARLVDGIAQMTVSTALPAPPDTDMTDISDLEDGDGDVAKYSDDDSDEKTERMLYPQQPEIYCPICTVEYGHQSTDDEDDKDAYVEGPLCLGCGHFIGTRCYEMITFTAERKEREAVCPFCRAPLEGHDYYEDEETITHDEHMSKGDEQAVQASIDAGNTLQASTKSSDLMPIPDELSTSENAAADPWPQIQRLVVLGELSSPLNVLRQDHPDSNALVNAAFNFMRQLRDFINRPLRPEHIGESSSTQNGRSRFNWYGQRIRNCLLRLREQIEREMGSTSTPDFLLSCRRLSSKILPSLNLCA